MLKAFLVCGDRNWTDHATLFAALDERQPDLVIEGEARGADKWARAWAEQRRRAFEGWPADWQREGRAAGPIRNRRMLARLKEFENEGYEIRVVAFHSDLENSKGTKDMVLAARKAGVAVEVIG